MDRTCHPLAGLIARGFGAAALLLLALPTQVAVAHGVDITATTREAVEVVALFEGGEPMAGAQVSVFAPDEPAEPWLTGTTDDEGRFVFAPDTEEPGLWEIQVRQAGHGSIVRVELSPDGVTEAVAGGLTTGQRAVMALSVVWGLVGTALYFRRRTP